MIGIIVEIEAAVDARGVVLVAAGALAVFAALVGGADSTTLAAIFFIGTQVDACLPAGVERTEALPGVADFVRSAGLIAAAAVRFIDLGVDARLIAFEQWRDASLHTLSVEAEIVAGLIAAAAMLGVGGGVDTIAVARGLADLADEFAFPHHAGLIPGADIVAAASVRRRVVGVDADAVADVVGAVAIVFAGPVHAKFVVSALDPARATVLEAALGVDANAPAPPLLAGALDDTVAALAHLVVETRLIAATAVQDITIWADTGAIAVDLVRLETTLSIRRERIDEISIREVGVFFATAPRRDQREQGDPHVLRRRQHEAAITARADTLSDPSTDVLAAIHEQFFRREKVLRGGAHIADNDVDGQ